MNTAAKQPIGKTYAQIIKFGRLLKNYQSASDLADDRPDVILGFVESIDKQLQWTKIDDFFTVFTPIKRYANDDTWDYKSTMEMIQDDLGTHFGKDDFKRLIMNSCFNNKYLPLLGFAFMTSISSMHGKQTGRNLFLDFLNNQSEEEPRHGKT